MKILFTGGTGFIGRNIIPLLSQRYNVFHPNRNELNLLVESDVDDYLRKNEFDIVIHSANTNPRKNAVDSIQHMTEDSLRTFANLYSRSNLYGKMLYFGSGAEYGKHRDIHEIIETGIGQVIPLDAYGFAKYIMNCMAQNSTNIYNLRLFGCYGPYDYESKFITHAIRCCIDNRNITIRQNCLFDYIQVFDLDVIIDYFIRGNPQYHDYNICSGLPVSLYDIANQVKRLMNSSVDIELLSDGWNKEYTGNNTRFLKDIDSSFKFMALEEGIKLQIEHERKYYK